MSEVRGWIGVDLDGTLAHYDKWRGEAHIGAPIMPMVERIKQWLADGSHDVKVFTARVSARDAEERAAVESAIHSWCEQHIGQRLEVVCAKDYSMVALWDDRATQVIPNEGVALADAYAALAAERDALARQIRAVEVVKRRGWMVLPSPTLDTWIASEPQNDGVWQDRCYAASLPALGQRLIEGGYVQLD